MGTTMGLGCREYRVYCACRRVVCPWALLIRKNFESRLDALRTVMTSSILGFLMGRRTVLAKEAIEEVVPQHIKVFRELSANAED